jgi:hypothetical protein
MDILLLSSSRYSAGIHLLFGQDQLDGSPINNVGDDRGGEGLRSKKGKGKSAKGKVRSKMKKNFSSFTPHPLRHFSPLTGYELVGDPDVVRIKQALCAAGSNKSNMGGGGNVGSEIKGLWNLAGVAAVQVISLQGGPRWSAIV